MRLARCAAKVYRYNWLSRLVRLWGFMDIDGNLTAARSADCSGGGRRFFSDLPVSILTLRDQLVDWAGVGGMIR